MIVKMVKCDVCGRVVREAISGDSGTWCCETCTVAGAHMSVNKSYPKMQPYLESRWKKAREAHFRPGFKPERPRAEAETSEEPNIQLVTGLGGAKTILIEGRPYFFDASTESWRPISVDAVKTLIDDVNHRVAAQNADLLSRVDQSAHRIGAELAGLKDKVQTMGEALATARDSVKELRHDVDAMEVFQNSVETRFSSVDEVISNAEDTLDRLRDIDLDSFEDAEDLVYAVKTMSEGLPKFKYAVTEILSMITRSLEETTSERAERIPSINEKIEKAREL